jgi:hypothetical protein
MMVSIPTAAGKALKSGDVGDELGYEERRKYEAGAVTEGKLVTVAQCSQEMLYTMKFIMPIRIKSKMPMIL